MALLSSHSLPLEALIIFLASDIGIFLLIWIVGSGQLKDKKKRKNIALTRI